MHTKHYSIYIIILNWNGYFDTEECILSLEKISYPNFRILIVDNGSSNDDYSKLREKFPNIELIKSEINLGFSGGNNLGILHALKQNPDYILLLNNDTIVTPDFITHLMYIFENHENAGIVAPVINYYSERNKLWSAGGKINKLRGAGISVRVLDTEKQKESKVEFVSGCCMLIPTQCLMSIGLFDDKYFLYSEDTDLCARFLKADKEIYLSTNSIIYHKTKSSTRKNISELALYYETRNRLYFIKKNYPGYIYLTFFYIFLVMLIKSLFWLIRGELKLIKAVIYSFKDFIIGNMGKTSFLNH